MVFLPGTDIKGLQSLPEDPNERTPAGKKERRK
jgi:hypothetical protein